MKVLLVNGSPHKAGTTHAALSLVGEALVEDGIAADEFWISNKPIAGCIGCMSCATTGTCVFKDTVQEFQALAHDYDGFVFGAAVHYGGINGSMKAFMDRAFYSNRGDGAARLRLKPAAGVVAARRMGTTAALEIFDKYFELAEMPVVSSRYWNAIHGHNAEQALRDEEGVQVMRQLGHNMAWLLGCIEAGRAAGIEPPAEPTPRVATNFIR